MAGIEFTAYLDELFGGEDEILESMRVEAAECGLPSIQVPLDTGRLLQLLIVQSGARRVVEVGTLFGYSAVLMARALPDDGRITSFELDPSRAELARSNFRRAGVGDKIEVVVGPAIDGLARLDTGSVDFTFIDADKVSYPAYLQQALRVSHAGSIIAADNVWRGGSVARPDSTDPDQVALAAFSRALASNDDLISTIVPMRNGDDALSVSVVR